LFHFSGHGTKLFDSSKCLESQLGSDEDIAGIEGDDGPPDQLLDLFEPRYTNANAK
jgi:hypothetical protein